MNKSQSTFFMALAVYGLAQLEKKHKLTRGTTQKILTLFIKARNNNIDNLLLKKSESPTDNFSNPVAIIHRISLTTPAQLFHSIFKCSEKTSHSFNYILEKINTKIEKTSCTMSI